MSRGCPPRAYHCLLVLVLSAFCPSSLPADTVDAAGVDVILADAIRFWKVPGLAVAIVHDDKVVYLKGAGVRQQGKPEPVTADTVFPIGSVTKAFTATAIGLLIDDGKMGSWDDSVRKHVSFFRLADPLADRDVTLRDLLCHRTGLSRHDNLWYRAPWSVEESVRGMGKLQPSAPFRSTYLYNNLAYLASGLAVSSAAGMPWQEFVRKRLCEPLHMRPVVFTRSEVLAVPDHAMPHHAEGDNVRVIDFYDDDKQIRASGSIKTSARALANWARLQMNEGVFDGKQVVPAKILAETHMPQIVAPLDAGLARLAGTTQVSYGLGWRIYDYRGQPLLEHGGAVDGFRARLLLLPRKRLGVVMLTNLDVMDTVLATGNRLLDRLLKLPPRDWNTHYRQKLTGQEEAERP